MKHSDHSPAPEPPPHRVFIGPPEHYELLSARHFMLFFLLGMRERHTFLDFGCGSLRSGRLVMTYLMPGRYCGIEPNRWLIDAAIEQEIGRSMVQIKQPKFAFNSDGVMTSFGMTFDFIHAHSVLTHAPPSLTRTFFNQAATVLSPRGLVVATFLGGTEDYNGTEWVYPDLITYRMSTLTAWASEAGLHLQPIRWPHRNQTYFVAARSSAEFPAVFEPPLRDFGIDLLPPASTEAPGS
jgi:SAM-dependent methyltransferase